MENIPTDISLAQQIEEAIRKDNNLKQCFCCAHYNRATGACRETKMSFLPYVRGCNGKFFEAEMDFLVKRVREDLKEQALKCDKIENYLALGLTTVNAASCFFTRLHKMVKDVREEEKDKTKRQLLYKDLEMINELQRGIGMIEKEMSSLYEVVDEKMEEIDRLYRLFIEPITNRMFTKHGRYDDKKGDMHLNNSFWFCKLLTKATIMCFDNEENEKALFGFLDGMTNDRHYALTHKDADSFEMRG